MAVYAGGRLARRKAQTTAATAQSEIKKTDQLERRGNLRAAGGIKCELLLFYETTKSDDRRPAPSTYNPRSQFLN